MQRLCTVLLHDAQWRKEALEIVLPQATQSVLGAAAFSLGFSPAPPDDEDPDATEEPLETEPPPEEDDEAAPAETAEEEDEVAEEAEPETREAEEDTVAEVDSAEVPEVLVLSIIFKSIHRTPCC